MSDQSLPINPYAPPASPVRARQSTFEYWLWREGETLVVRAGARLPRCCMVTGEPAPYAHPINQIWQPRWVYLLAILAVLPYLLLSPFVHRRVELTVPFGRTLFRKHQRWIKLGMGLMILSMGLLIACIAGSIGNWISATAAFALVGGVVLFLVGLQIASSSPMRLNILKVDRDLIYIDDVHPAYLATLPDLDSIDQAARWLA